MSCGELYTILTNKSKHGKKGSLIACIKGVNSNALIRVLSKISDERRNIVKEVTVDMSPALNKVIKACFPKATIVIDRFHVQQLANDALQDLRIKHRWSVLDTEAEKIKRARRNGVKYHPEI